MIKLKDLLKEEHEIFTASELIRKSALKLKPLLEKVMQQVKSKGLITSYKVKLVPYNEGIRFYIDSQLNYEFKSDEYKDIYKFIHGYSMYIYPGSFFQDRIDENKPAAFEFQPFIYKNSLSDFNSLKNTTVKTEAQIKNFIDKFFNLNKNVLEKILKDLK